MFNVFCVYDGRQMVELPGLRRQRQLAMLSQEELGRLAGVQRFTITRLENGGSAHPSTMRKLVEALGCSSQDLLDPPDRPAAF